MVALRLCSVSVPSDTRLVTLSRAPVYSCGSLWILRWWYVIDVKFEPAISWRDSIMCMFIATASPCSSEGEQGWPTMAPLAFIVLSQSPCRPGQSRQTAVEWPWCRSLSNFKKPCLKCSFIDNWSFQTYRVFVELGTSFHCTLASVITTLIPLW